LTTSARLRGVERVMPDVDIEGEQLLETLHPARP
jgi:hypothetical protein